MIQALFPHLPDSSRLWVYGVGRPLTEDEESDLLARVDTFLDGWKAHGHPLAAAREWLYGRFLLVGVDDGVTPPSGCSIDALVRILRSMESDLETEIVGGAAVWYADGEGHVERVSRAEFKERAESGLVSEETTVFDPSITRVGELRAGEWERPAGDGWHRKYLSPRSNAL